MKKIMMSQVQKVTRMKRKVDLRESRIESAYDHYERTDSSDISVEHKKELTEHFNSKLKEH